ncbi:MAG: hypothetical protein AB7F89_14180 [Pirellulaceae bacterium]
MEFTELLERFGFPTLIVLVGAVAIWRVIVWFGTNIAKPLVGSHVEFLSAVQANVTIQTGLLQTIAKIQMEQNEILAFMRDRFDREHSK